MLPYNQIERQKKIEVATTTTTSTDTICGAYTIKMNKAAINPIEIIKSNSDDDESSDDDDDDDNDYDNNNDDDNNNGEPPNYDVGGKIDVNHIKD